jgi:hypothetical protein
MLERVAAAIVVGLLRWLESRRTVASADVDAAHMRRVGAAVRQWLQQDNAGG